VYLWIKEDQVEIRDASHLWGKLTGEVEDMIREELDDQFIRVAQCGPAGENLVRFALVNNDLNEVAGRTGMGAVMGSKKLRGIAVRGTKNVPIAAKDGIKEIAKWVSSTLDENHRAFHEYGTGAAMQAKSLEGGLPTENYRWGAMDTVTNVDAVRIKEQARIDMTACYACSVRCKKVVQVEQRQEDAGVTRKGVQIAFDPKGRWRVDPKYGGPEYESLAALGPTVGVDDLVAVLKGNEMCNALGMDTISLGATIAFAIECYEKELLTKTDTGGIELSFKSPELLIELIEMIAYRRGYGDALAEGSQRLAATIGQGSEEFLTTIKGMEMAMHDPRHMERMRLSYLMAPTGGDHMQQHGNKNGLRNQVGLCHFLAYDDDQSLQILRSITGWDVTPEEMVTMAHRGLTLARLFNLREGFTPADDALPKRFSEDLPMHKGLPETEMRELVNSYYEEQGWDADGRPTIETMKALDLEEHAVAV
jgi:aldehyde:ferredoxin oxidoreductase